MSKPKAAVAVDIPSSILSALLTPSELRMVKQRFAIMAFIKRGLSIRDIAGRVKVGTDTVVRTARLLEGNQKLKDFFESEAPTKQSSSKWVFGQVGSKEE